MKIFGWMQRKLKSAAQDESTNKPNSNNANYCSDQAGKEDVNEWLNGLLAIGTLGLKKDCDLEIRTNVPCPKFEKLLHNQDDNNEQYSASELEQIQLMSSEYCDNTRFSSEVVLRGGKDVSVEYAKRDRVGKKLLAFLVKKIFFCRSGFSLPPTSPTPESRIDKILRAMIHMKIYPQSHPSSSLLVKKYLDNNNKPISVSNTNADDMNDKPTKGNKWVKTDSEYIVLEI